MSDTSPPTAPEALTARLALYIPFSYLPKETVAGLAGDLTHLRVEAGEVPVRLGDPLDGLYIIESGIVEMQLEGQDTVSVRGPGDVFGARGAFGDGKAHLTARAETDCVFLVLARAACRRLAESEPGFEDWFSRTLPRASTREAASQSGVTAMKVADMMSADPVACDISADIGEVARLMRTHNITSVLVLRGGALAGIVTARDLTDKVLAEGRDASAPVREIMTRDPVTIHKGDLGLDALLKMSERRIKHMPVVDASGPVGMIGQSDFFRHQVTNASRAVSEIAAATSAEDMVRVVEQAPRLLAQLVGAGAAPDAVCRRITDITDAVTRRLLTLAEEKFGAPPVPYLWLACGSQGRREQTGTSDQDNCLILDDAFEPEAHDGYFADLAKFVSDGLNTCGFVYCPGDMMATNPRWRQPRRIWEAYFEKWINRPDNEAQMLASVMFDLRPIGGETALFGDLQRQTLAKAQKNSIFVQHMTANSLKHSPPLSLFRGFSLIRSGAHRNMIDMKMSGVVPIVDLGRVYALKGRIEAANTRQRLEEARERKVVSEGGARDLIDAYELIAQLRLKHQAAQIRAGEKPDNFMAPISLSELERNHLRDAFQVVKTMQSAAGSIGAAIS